MNKFVKLTLDDNNRIIEVLSESSPAPIQLYQVDEALYDDLFINMSCYAVDGEFVIYVGKTEEQILLEQEASRLFEISLSNEKNEQYLADTDYVVIKLYEAKIDEDNELYESLKKKYSEILAQRKIARESIVDVK